MPLTVVVLNGPVYVPDATPKIIPGAATANERDIEQGVDTQSDELEPVVVTKWFGVWPIAERLATRHRIETVTMY